SEAGSTRRPAAQTSGNFAQLAAGTAGTSCRAMLAARPRTSTADRSASNGGPSKRLWLTASGAAYRPVAASGGRSNQPAAASPGRARTRRPTARNPAPPSRPGTARPTAGTVADSSGATASAATERAGDWPWRQRVRMKCAHASRMARRTAQSCAGFTCRSRFSRDPEAMFSHGVLESPTTQRVRMRTGGRTMKSNTLAIALAALLVGGVAVAAFQNNRTGDGAFLTNEDAALAADEAEGRGLEYAQVVAVDPVTESR